MAEGVPRWLGRWTQTLADFWRLVLSQPIGMMVQLVPYGVGMAPSAGWVWRVCSDGVG